MSGAARGGFSTVCCMPNTNPVNDNKQVTEYILAKAAEIKLVRVLPVAAISKGLEGNSLCEYKDLKKARAVAVSDDGNPVMNSRLMRSALEQAKDLNLLAISHCEDIALAASGAMNEGDVSKKLGITGIPGASESIMVLRDIALSELTGAAIHIAHVSTRESVKLIGRARNEGIKVTAETAPHYFSLDHGAVDGYNTNTKVNPPLRTREDVEAIKEGLVDGAIDSIATDHAPHSHLEKDVEFDKAAFGMIGLESALALTLELVRNRVLKLPEAIGKLSSNPAKILGIPGGRIVEGGEADLAMIDPEYEYVLREDDIISKSKNSPFIGRTLKGRNELTMLGGEIVWESNT